jgi:hypothetical protein
MALRILDHVSPQKTELSALELQDLLQPRASPGTRNCVLLYWKAVLKQLNPL